MARWLRQSTQSIVKLGPFISTTDGDTEKPSLTIAQTDILISKNGGAFGTISTTTNAFHDTHSYYGVTFSTIDSDTLGRLRVQIHVATALPVWDDFMVMNPAIFDALTGTYSLTVVPVSGTITTVTGAVNSVTSAVTLTSAYDSAKTAAPASTALSNATWTNTMAGYLDASISSRAVATTALSSATWTNTMASYLDAAITSRSTFSGGTISGVTNPVTLTAAYDAAKTAGNATAANQTTIINDIATRAPASTALSNLTFTTTIAGYLDAAISSRAPAATALSSATWTDQKAGFIDTTISTVGGGALTAGGIADAVWDEAMADHLSVGSTGAKLNAAAAAAGGGGTAWTYTLTDVTTSLPIAGVNVWVTTDSAGNNIVASGVTDAFGAVTFYLDPGTYYLWRSGGNHDYTNPQTISVPSIGTGSGTLSTSAPTTTTGVGLGFIPTS